MLATLLALKIILVYPGAAGSPQEAEGFLQSLGRYVDKKSGWPPGTAQVSYFNDLAAGTDALRRADAAVAAVSMPALCAAGDVPYRYVCSPRLGGHASETVTIVRAAAAAKTAPGDLPALKGLRVTGTLLSFPAYVDALVLQGKARLSDFVAVPKPTALLALKALQQGEADLAILTQSQAEALAGVGMGSLSEVWRSEPIPTAPVIAIGKVDEAQVAAVAKAFLGMCADAEGAELCDTMGVAGFSDDQGAALAKAIAACKAPAPANR